MYIHTFTDVVYVLQYPLNDNLVARTALNINDEVSFLVVVVILNSIHLYYCTVTNVHAPQQYDVN